MTVVEERLSVLDSLVLDKGNHSSLEKGACVMEAVSYVAGEAWSDHPKCASKIITSFLVSWNDSLPDEDRQMLKPLITKVIGTATTTRDEEIRAWMCTDWLARECAPAFLRLAGLTEQAEKLGQLAALTDSRSAKKAQSALNGVRKDADAAWDAAWDAARDAAQDAAWAAARKTKDEGGGYDAQYKAAYEASTKLFAEPPFSDTIKALQVSAYQLVERMCEVGR